MNSLVMNFQPAGSWVPFRTPHILAHEGFLASMGQLVCLQVTLGDEMFAAQGAREGAFTCVSAHMRLQVASFCELFQALLEGTVQNPLLFFRTFDFLYDLTRLV